MTSVKTPNGNISAADLKRWGDKLRRGETLTYLECLQAQNFCCVLRDEYLGLLEAFRESQVRVNAAQSPLNDLARMAIQHRQFGEFDVEAAVNIIWKTVEEFREINGED